MSRLHGVHPTDQTELLKVCRSQEKVARHESGVFDLFGDQRGKLPVGIEVEPAVDFAVVVDRAEGYDLRVGEHPRVTSALDSVVGPKNTAMGEGYFVTSRNTWYVDHPDGQSEVVATMLFRVLKFIPKAGS